MIIKAGNISEIGVFFHLSNMNDLFWFFTIGILLLIIVIIGYLYYCVFIDGSLDIYPAFICVIFLIMPLVCANIYVLNCAMSFHSEYVTYRNTLAEKGVISCKKDGNAYLIKCYLN